MSKHPDDSIRLLPADQVDKSKSRQSSIEERHNSRVFGNLPDDIIATVSEFCNMETLCALSSTSRSLFKQKFVGSIKLTRKASEKFLNNHQFREKMQARLLFPRIHKIHIQKKALTFDKATLAALIQVKNLTCLQLEIS